MTRSQDKQMFAGQLLVDEPEQVAPPPDGVGFVQVRVCVLADCPQEDGQEAGLHPLHPPVTPQPL